MKFECAKCSTNVCLAGDREHGPSFCPMHSDFPAAGDLYKDLEIRNVARVAAQIEAAGYRRWRRAEEIMEFSKKLGFSKLGIVFCNDMAGIANLCIDVLQAKMCGLLNPLRRGRR